MVESYLNCSIWPSHTVPTRAMPALLSHSVLMLGPHSTQGLVTWTCPGQYLNWT